MPQARTHQLILAGCAEMLRTEMFGNGNNILNVSSSPDDELTDATLDGTQKSARLYHSGVDGVYGPNTPGISRLNELSRGLRKIRTTIPEEEPVRPYSKYWPSDYTQSKYLLDLMKLKPKKPGQPGVEFSKHEIEFACYARPWLGDLTDPMRGKWLLTAPNFSPHPSALRGTSALSGDFQVAEIALLKEGGQRSLIAEKLGIDTRFDDILDTLQSEPWNSSSTMPQDRMWTDPEDETTLPNLILYTSLHGLEQVSALHDLQKKIYEWLEYRRNLQSALENWQDRFQDAAGSSRQSSNHEPIYWTREGAPVVTEPILEEFIRSNYSSFNQVLWHTLFLKDELNRCSPTTDGWVTELSFHSLAQYVLDCRKYVHKKWESLGLGNLDEWGSYSPF